MVKWYIVEWYKECYPFRDECGKIVTKNKTEAYEKEQWYLDNGYHCWIRILSEEDFEMEVANEY